MNIWENRTRVEAESRGTGGPAAWQVKAWSMQTPFTPPLHFDFGDKQLWSGLHRTLWGCSASRTERVLQFQEKHWQALSSCSKQRRTTGATTQEPLVWLNVLMSFIKRWKNWRESCKTFSKYCTYFLCDPVRSKRRLWTIYCPKTKLPVVQVTHGF